MSRILIPFILFLLLVLEGVALDLLPVSFIANEFQLVPHWVLIFLILKIMFFDGENTSASVIHGLIFGFLIDVVYTGVLGVYMFCYALVIYMIHSLVKVLHANFYAAILLSIIGVALTDIFINIIFSVAGITEMIWQDYLLYRLIPTALANGLFLFVLYPLLTKLLMKWKEERYSKGSTYF
ncbi:rod shape-determining protein MreD [Lentibacillus cibarius]|uniref:Rod shape-determining protein MreD n=1 Tax=Lentibacillus cibarius TaxID=2583219 RepID=A0A549YLR6_9BACI|nr:rod shape-determining protein MreD [Lentibacillus cibarius]TRM12831.1 rod shape-determining protein MreD [Lentibacillus cibarius]